MPSKFPIWGEATAGNTTTVELGRAQPTFGHVNYDTNSEAIQQGTGALGQGVQNVAAFIDRERDEADKQASLEQNNQYRMRAASLVAQFSTLQGKQAMEAQPKLSGELVRLREQYASEAPNKRASDYFTMRSADPLVSADREVKNHAAKEYVVWQESNHRTAQELLDQELQRQFMLPGPLDDTRMGQIRTVLDQLQHAGIEYASFRGLDGLGQLQTMQAYVASSLAKSLTSAIKEERSGSAEAILNIINGLPREQYGAIAEQFRSKHAEVLGQAVTLIDTQRAVSRANDYLNKHRDPYGPPGMPDYWKAVSDLQADFRAGRITPLDFARTQHQMSTQWATYDRAKTEWSAQAANDLNREYGKQWELFGRQGPDAFFNIPAQVRARALIAAPAAYLSYLRASSEDANRSAPSPEQDRAFGIIADMLADPAAIAMPEGEFEAVLQKLHPSKRDFFRRERHEYLKAMNDPGRRRESVFLLTKEAAVGFDPAYGVKGWEDNDTDGSKAATMRSVYGSVQTMIDAHVTKHHVYPTGAQIRSMATAAWGKARITVGTNWIGAPKTETIPWGVARDLPYPKERTMPVDFIDATRAWLMSEPNEVKAMLGMSQKQVDEYVQGRASAVWMGLEFGQPLPWSNAARVAQARDATGRGSLVQGYTDPATGIYVPPVGEPSMSWVEKVDSRLGLLNLPPEPVGSSHPSGGTRRVVPGIRGYPVRPPQSAAAPAPSATGTIASH